MLHRLLALSMDGTFLRGSGRLNRVTKEAIQYASEKGVTIILMTSQSFPLAKRIAKVLELDSYIISHQGAFIASELEKPVFVKRIPEDITTELVQFLESFECQIKLSHDQFALANKIKLPDNFLGKIILQQTNRAVYSEQYVNELSEKLMDDPISPPNLHILFENNDDLLDAKTAFDGVYVEVRCTIAADYKLIIVPKGVSKLHGLMYVSEKLGISKEDVVMIGAALDDIPAIEWAGLGVALGDAPAKVQKSAEWVTRSQAENGVAYMVKEHFRKQQPIQFLKKMNVIK